MGKNTAFIFGLLILFSSLGALFSSQPIVASPQLKYEASIAITETRGSLQVELFTINSTGSYKAWTLAALNNLFETAWIDDIDSDNNLEFIGLSKEAFLQVYDLRSDQLEWQFKLPFTDSSVPLLVATDLNGDGKKEILFSKQANHAYSNVWNSTVTILDYQGNIIQNLYRDDPYLIRFYGADNIIPLPTENGRNALIVSYGNTAYNTTDLYAFDGAYVLERWDWDDTKNSLTRTWQVMGDDNGGNLEIIIVNHAGRTLIVTAGWYNNPVRVFDAKDGTLLWERKLLEIQDPDLIQMVGNTKLAFVHDEKQSFILAGISTYFYVFPTKIFALDPLTGKDVIPPREFEKASQNVPVSDGKSILLAQRVHFDLEDPNLASWQAIALQTDTLETIETIQGPEGEQFAPIRAMDVARIPQSPISVAIGFDAEAKLWLLTPDGAFPLAKPVGSIVSAIIFTDSIVPGKELLHSFAEKSFVEGFLSRFGLVSIALIMSVLLAILIISFYKYDKRRKFLRGEKIFDEYWESIDWRSYFSARLNKIFGDSSNSATLPDSVGSTHQSFPSEKPIFISTTDTGFPRDLEENKGQGQIVLVPPNFPHLRSWINTHATFAQKIKISDIALMIEIQNLHPDRPTRKEIVAKFKFVPQSTLYDRIKKLEKFGLLKSNQLITQVNDMRYGLLELTDAGKELLHAIHISFSSTPNL